MRVRVVDPNARVSELDPTSLTDHPSISGAQGTSDLRELQAPLPRLGVGSVVEEEITTVDRDVLPGGGQLARLGIGTYGVPTLTTRLRVTSPAAKKLPLVVRGLPASVKPQRSVAGGRQVVTYTVGTLLANDTYEAYVPPDVVTSAYVAVSAAPSWQAVARAYRTMIDKQLADGAVAFPAELPKARTLEATRKIVTWLHRQVRYSDIDLSSSTYLPSLPSDTLKRGIADAKDKAVLLISLLRGAGLEADLVLASSGRDPNRDVPALNAFDYPLVRVKLATELWVDPLDESSAPGQLPSYLQGRRALVIANDAVALTTTPASKPEDNLVREVRTFDAAEDAGAKVTEVSREMGAFEAAQRSWIRTTTPAEIRKGLGNYVKSEFANAELDRYSTTAVDDLATPFEMTVVATGSSRVFTTRDQIDVHVFPVDTLEKLPGLLGEPRDDAPPRKQDLLLTTPFVHELESRIVVPPGFTMPAPAADKLRQLGPMKLVERQRVDGRTFVVSFRFDTVKRRLTAAEVAEVQRAVRELRKEQSLHLVFANTAVALLDGGKVKDAMVEIERVSKLHPKEGIHHGELARVYISVGAGAAARREARKAVELEPGVADHQVVLGWVLTHDTVGRRYTGDFDRAGARTAFERARTIDPKHIGALKELGMLLERDARGGRFDRGSEFAGALAAYRAAYAVEPDQELGLSILRVQLFSGKHADAEQFARTLAPDETRDALLLAGVAGARGVPEAIRVASTLASGAARVQRLTAAGGILFLARSYEPARTLMHETNAVKPGSAEATMFTKIVRHDTPFKPSAQPQDVAMELMLASLLPGRSAAIYWDADVQRRTLAAKGTTKIPNREAMTDALVEDLMRSLITPKVEGDAAAWRVEVEQGGHKGVVYLAADKGVAKIIGGKDALEGLGRHVLRLLAKNDEKASVRLLDWLDKDLAGKPSAFGAVWGANLPRTRQAMELAAAVLADETMIDRTLPLLERCGATTTEGQFVCDLFAAGIYRKRQAWSELAEHADEWTKRSTKTTIPPAMRAVALAHLGKPDEGDKIVDDLLAAHAGDGTAGRASVEIAIIRGKLADAIRRSETVAKAVPPNAGSLNNLAWLRLVEGTDLPAALADAQKSVQLEADDSNSLHTLASIEAEVGQLTDAWKHGLASMTAAQETAPSDAMLFVHGRILEQLGLKADAIAAYRRDQAERRTCSSLDSSTEPRGQATQGADGASVSAARIARITAGVATSMRGSCATSEAPIPTRNPWGSARATAGARASDGAGGQSNLARAGRRGRRSCAGMLERREARRVALVAELHAGRMRRRALRDNAVVAFQRPDRHQQFFRNAELPLDARQQPRRGFCISFSGAIDARGNDAGRGVFLEAFAGKVPRWRRSKLSTAGSLVTPAKAWSITARETPAACASRGHGGQEGVWKSPPHWAADRGDRQGEKLGENKACKNLNMKTTRVLQVKSLHCKDGSLSPLSHGRSGMPRVPYDNPPTHPNSLGASVPLRTHTTRAR